MVLTGGGMTSEFLLSRVLVQFRFPAGSYFTQ